LTATAEAPTPEPDIERQGKMLSKETIGFYRENGYLVLPQVLGPDEVTELRAVTDELVAAARGVTGHTALYDLEDAHTPERPMVRRLKTPHAFHERYAAVTRHPGIVAAMRPLIGEAVNFDNSKLNLKAAGGGAPVDWHQDWAFYPHTNDDLCAVGIMLDDMDLENGPLMVVPGSHRGPTYDHHSEGYFSGAINDAAAEPGYAKAVALTGKAGSITIHRVRAVHGSRPNISGRDRRLLLLQYRAADAWPLLNPPSWDEWCRHMVSGAATLAPRFVQTPVRLPLPPARHQGSIYENQRGSRAAILGHAPDKAAAVAAE
jgi:ectoine hydroxylase-related dioxygenase (phytanoyl-CoA dioxygenase family)